MKAVKSSLAAEATRLTLNAAELRLEADELIKEVATALERVQDSTKVSLPALPASACQQQHSSMGSRAPDQPALPILSAAACRSRQVPIILVGTT